MSLLNPRLSLETAFKIKSAPEFCGSEVALLGKSLWNLLSPGDDSHRLYVSATSNRHGTSHDLRAVSFWAVLDEQTDELAIPPAWLTTYQRVFTLNGPSITLKVLKPIPLTEMVITALSPEAYEAGLDALDSWLCDGQRVLRQGDTCTFTSTPLVNGSGVHRSSVPFQYRLDMLEPVMQGYATKGETKIILTLDASVQQDEQDCDSDPEGFEIDEHFLAPALLGSLSQAIVSQTTENITFQCQVLAESESQVYEDCTLYLRTTDLGRAGGLNGDWVVVHSPGSNNRRLVRVIANDSLSKSKCAAFNAHGLTLTESQVAWSRVPLYFYITYARLLRRSLP
ncbi:hypothetical protein C8R43DRAFT_339470 [Mycena crocata]|nr:hypothetical protein C8R43DRAFT_339470 [Mycena crocata]